MVRVNIIHNQSSIESNQPHPLKTLMTYYTELFFQKCRGSISTPILIYGHKKHILILISNTFCTIHLVIFKSIRY